ncbi:SGNH/GDSL hydrolase family protein [Agreia sp. Leaf244]|uniref:SGNH/GDSL hydrolase family protein n=1 Tax=Agreia sp. Leaf244 TaxID=1736305 RepID=UPI0009E80859|nr:SGNH/GDSL hydrolase family protein [Agreia sp. Leaf244]
MPKQTHVTVPLTSRFIRGAHRLEAGENGVVIHRLPEWALEQAADAQLALVETQPSGVRIVFSSVATSVDVTVRRFRTTLVGFPERPDGVLELAVDGEVIQRQTTDGGDTTTIDMATGASAVRSGPLFVARFAGLPEVSKVIEIWLPHNESLEIVSVTVNAAVDVVPAQDRHWVHYGSSISQGSNAIRPTDIWPVVAARTSGVDLTNFGFGGSALLDAFMARIISDVSADAITLKIGINLVNTDAMRLRAFRSALHGFIDVIRDGHPLTPLVLISPIYCGIHETTPGPSGFDLTEIAGGRVRFVADGAPGEKPAGQLTLTIIRDEMERIVRERAITDPHLHYLDGLLLYGEHDAREHPLPDNLHPDESTQRMMGERFVQLAINRLNLFTSPEGDLDSGAGSRDVSTAPGS